MSISVGNSSSALKGALRANDFAQKASNTRIYISAKNPHLYSPWTGTMLFPRKDTAVSPKMPLFLDRVAPALTGNLGP